jgi:hypothetical protein
MINFHFISNFVLKLVTKVSKHEEKTYANEEKHRMSEHKNILETIFIFHVKVIGNMKFYGLLY